MKPPPPGTILAISPLECPCAADDGREEAGAGRSQRRDQPLERTEEALIEAALNRQRGYFAARFGQPGMRPWRQAAQARRGVKAIAAAEAAWVCRWRGRGGQSGGIRGSSPAGMLAQAAGLGIWVMPFEEKRAGAGPSFSCSSRRPRVKRLSFDLRLSSFGAGGGGRHASVMLRLRPRRGGPSSGPTLGGPRVFLLGT
jgi:hypothetical protein